MVNLDLFKDRYARDLERITTEKKARQTKIDKARASALKKINSAFDNQIRAEEQKSQLESNIAEGAYAQDACAEMIDALDRDYQIMAKRGSLLSLTPEDLVKGTNVLQRLQSIADEGTRKRMEEMALELDPKLKEILPLITNAPDMTPVKITSYIAQAEELGNRSSGKDVKIKQCYLLVPCRDNDANSSLMKSLESRVTEVVSHERIECSHNTHIAKTLTVESSSSHKIEFACDLEARNGYILYTLTPDNPKEIANLIACLSRKLSDANIQPKNFEKSKLRHEVIKVDGVVLDYFRTHERQTLDTPQDSLRRYTEEKRTVISIEEAARISKYTISGLRNVINQGRIEGADKDNVPIAPLLKYLAQKDKRTSDTPNPDNLLVRPARNHTKRASAEEAEGIRREIYARLDKISKGSETEEITLRQLGEVLGLGGTTKVYGLIKRIPQLRCSTEQSVNRYFIPIRDARKFISDYTPRIEQKS